MHVFVTGGTGFFGKALLRHWASKRSTEAISVTLLSRSPNAFRERHADLLEGLDIRFHEGDILRPDSLPRTGEFTHVIHAATDSTLGPSLSPLARHDQIVTGSRHLLDMAVRMGIKRVLVTSSGGVYGAQPPDMATTPEDFHGMPDPLNPQNAYSIAKRSVEHLCALYRHEHDLEPVIARCFAFVGEDLPLDAHFAIGNFIRDALTRRQIVVNGDGTPLRSYLDQRDLARWLMTLLMHGEPMRAYNVGSDVALSIAEVATLVQRVSNSEQDVRILGAPPAGQSAARSRYVPDISRARNELGLHVEVTLEDAIAHVLTRRADAPHSSKVTK